MSRPIEPDMSGARRREQLLSQRRALLKKGIALAAAGAGLGTAASALGALKPEVSVLGINGTYDVLFSSSSAVSAWFNGREGQRMNARDFPRTGLAAQGRIAELSGADATARGFIVAFMDPARVAPTMRGLVPYGAGAFAAFNANCKHFHCTALWREEAEAESLVNLKVDLDHDFVVCGCHLSAYDLYDSGKVVKPPAPRPLDQLKLQIASDGQIQIVFANYFYDGAAQV